MIFIGLLIGFYGYLFPGNINLMVMDLYISKKYKILAVVLLLIVLFESIYCFFTLSLLTIVKENNAWYKWLETGSYILVLVMGIWMLLENGKSKKTVQKNTLYRGIISTIIHPQQIPFWLIIGVMINPWMVFGMNVFAMVGFVILNAIGVLLAMYIYMFFGQKILGHFNLTLSFINKVMGGVYIIIACYVLFRMKTFA